MTKLPWIILSCTLSMTGTATGQGSLTIAIPPDQTLPGAPPTVIGPPLSVEVDLLAVEPFEIGRAVTDRPYSATATTEFTQLLGDGNRIEHSTSAAVARDSRGRVRREHQAMVIGALAADREVPLVSITDPTTDTHITLDQERRVAHRLPVPPGVSVRGGNVAVAVDAGRAGASVQRSDDRGQAGGRPSAGLWVSEVNTRRTGTAQPVPTTRTERLGTRVIEGVRAEGTRTIVTIPARAIGNHSAIETISERWYSPELHTVVLTRRSDPRFGETTYRLTNIVRAEPPADLFEIPPGYRIEEPTVGPPRRR